MASRTICKACRGWGFVFPPKGYYPEDMPDCPFCATPGGTGEGERRG